MGNPYEILGISSLASPKDAKKAYFNLAKRFHPDVNKSPDAEEIFKTIKNAYETLTQTETTFKTPPKPQPSEKEKLQSHFRRVKKTYDERTELKSKID